METSQHPYADLTPVTVLEAVESLGYETDARIFPLNSYENRVYQVGIADKQSIIVKFYRFSTFINVILYKILCLVSFEL